MCALHKNFSFLILPLWITVAFPWFTEAGQVHTTITDLGAVRISLPETTRYELGTAVSGVGDFNGDGFLDVAVGAPAYAPGGFGNEYDNGAVFIIFDHALAQERGEIDLSKNFDGVTVTGRFESRIGNALARVGDINADGFADLAFGSKTHSSGTILFGNKNPKRLIPLADLGKDGVEILHTGLTVAAAGDFNGDGFADVIFGNPYSEVVNTDNKEYHIGRVTLIYGRYAFPASIDSLLPGDTHVTIRGPAGALVGNGLAGDLDLNSDGLSDIVIVAPKDGKDYEGRTFVVHGQKVLDKIEYSFIIDHARRFAYPAKDVNGDGLADLLIGGEDSSIWLLWGGKQLNGTIDLRKNMNSSWGVRIEGAPYAYGVGDINGDGFNDIAVAMPNAAVGDKVLAGRVLFLYGRPQWPDTIDVQRICKGEFTPMDYTLVDGIEPFGLFGFSVAGVGDIQGDGFEDVIIGAPTERLPEGTAKERPGSAYVIQGKSLDFTLHTYRSNFTQGETRRQ